MPIETRITNMEMDRQCSNGSYLYRGRARLGNEQVKFAVNTRSQVYVDQKGGIDYICLDPSQNLNSTFPIKEETLRFERNTTSTYKKRKAILAIFKEQYQQQEANHP